MLFSVVACWRLLINYGFLEWACGLNKKVKRLVDQKLDLNT